MPEYLDVGSMKVACRACGAVRGPRNDDDNAGREWRVCRNCWHSFERWFDGEAGNATEDDFNGWLARKLFLDLRRLERTGVLGRCEAVSDWLYADRRAGQQCALPAKIRLQDGHLVCGAHLKSYSVGNVAWVDGRNPNAPYEMLTTIISRLVKRDKRILEAISAGIGLDAQPLARKHGGGAGSSPIDLTGREFGRLTAIRIDRNRVGKGRQRYWLCRCACGTEKSIRSDALLHGYHLSCGCGRAEATKKRNAAQVRQSDGRFVPILPPIILS